MARRLMAVGLVVALLGCASSQPAARPRRDRPGSTASTTRPAGQSQSPVVAPLEWRACDAGECATLRVPVDYRKPHGSQLALAVARSASAKPEQKIGSLVINPGGPGASGVDIADAIATNLPRSITDRFDVVGWDTRGSGASSPVQCGDHLDYLFDIDTAPDDRIELNALETAAQRFVNDCVAKSGSLLRHIATADTVRDLDRLRAALGDEKLTYLGLSYGTYVGGIYASMFPDRVRALVLDGAVDPERPVADVAIEQAQGFGAGLDAFFAWCTNHRDCGFHHDGDPRAAYDTLARRIDEHPIVRDGVVFGPTHFDVAVAAILYGGASGYRHLADGLRDLERGATGTLSGAFDEYMGRVGTTYNAEWAAFIAITCADGPNLSLADEEATQLRAAVEAPEFGAANVGLGYQCSFWPYRATRSAQFTVAAPTAPPIVVVGTTGDPVTPIAWAEGLARQLGSGRLVRVAGTTHTSSLNGDACLDRLLGAYLVDLVAPSPSTTCA